MKDNKRALRRHHIERLKKSRLFHWGRNLTGRHKELGKAVNSPCSCSCCLCGNPRKWWNEKSIQERRQMYVDS
jgi:hypothetical protein